MEHRRIGRSGLSVSVIGLGCNAFGTRIDEESARSVVSAALENGITLFDTADSYGDSEVLLGRALGAHRSEIILLATKFGMAVQGATGNKLGGRTSRRYIRLAVERSLTRLGTDYIDLYQLHSPDPQTPIEETLGALTELVHEGKIRYIGSSNLSGWQIADADWISRSRNLERFVGAQNEYNLIDRRVETDIIPSCSRFGVGLLAYRPLGAGLLAGLFRMGQSPLAGTKLAERPDLLARARLDLYQRLVEFSRQRDIEMLTLAIGGLASRPGVASVLVGATSADQVAANARAGKWVPDAEENEALNALTADAHLS